MTTRPPPLLPGPMALAVYRVRWPIEVAIQRWKRVLEVNWLRARDERPLAEVWWPGTFRDVLMLDRRLRRTRGAPWRGLDRMRTATWWRPWLLLQAEGAPRSTGVRSWPPPGGPTCRQVWAERPRRRQRQRRPQEVLVVFGWSTAHLEPSPQQAIAA